MTIALRRRPRAWAFDLSSTHEATLAERFVACLKSRKDTRSVGPHVSDLAMRVPTIAFFVENRMSSELVHALDNGQLATHFGDFYAARTIDALDLLASEGVVRLAHYNTLEEVVRLVGALAA